MRTEAPVLPVYPVAGDPVALGGGSATIVSHVLGWIWPLDEPEPIHFDVEDTLGRKYRVVRIRESDGRAWSVERRS